MASAGRWAALPSSTQPRRSGGLPPGPGPHAGSGPRAVPTHGKPAQRQRHWFLWVESHRTAQTHGALQSPASLPACGTLTLPLLQPPPRGPQPEPGGRCIQPTGGETGDSALKRQESRRGARAGRGRPLGAPRRCAGLEPGMGPCKAPAVASLWRAQGPCASWHPVLG